MHGYDISCTRNDGLLAITCDEIWIFLYDFVAKRQSTQCKCKFKAVMIVLFYIRDVVHMEWVPQQDQIVNQYYYLEELWIIRAKIGKRRRGMWKKNFWILHQDNAHFAEGYFTKKVTLMEHQIYSSDLAPRNFYPFLTMKSYLKGTRHESSEGVK